MVVADIDDVIRDAAMKGLKHLWLLGWGQLASSLLAKGLITNISISEMPISLGLGIPLFSDRKLEDIAAEERTILQKKGFRQIEVVVNRDWKVVL